MRINKLLSNYGYCSRKEANVLIENKRIIVNGEYPMKGQWVEESDEILFDNVPISKQEQIYLVLNKPVGVVCTSAKDVKNNIIDYLGLDKYIFPVGRLDKESQGLILLTNDGDLADKVLNSNNNHEKEYIVTLDKKYDSNFIKSMEKGVDIGGIITRECRVECVDDITFKIVLTQGLNRQIRKMCKTLGYTVIKLERIRIVNISIEGIEYGKFRHLSNEEVEELRKL